MSGAPYRDDPSAFVDFEQHIGIAIALLEQFTEIPRRMAMGEASDDAIEQLQREARVAWEGLWDQLTQARSIAAGKGRSVAAYDSARASAGDIWLNACAVHYGPWMRYGNQHRRTITWLNAPTAPAIAAISSLCAAVPEAVVRTAPPVDMDLRSRGWFSRYWWLIGLFILFTLIGLCSEGPHFTD